MADHVFTICEVGSNYNGSLDCALDYLRAAKRAGADAVKFQTLRKDKLVAPRIYVDGRWVENPVYKAFSSLELPDEWHFELKRCADQTGIEFFSTPFYLEAVDLMERAGVRTYKIASGDISFLPLLQAVGATGKRVIMSTGASALADIETALNVLTQSGARDITLLHCVANYPPCWEEMNLRAMVTLKEEFGLPVGISDHTPGSLVAIAAVALGAVAVEKHVTFDRGQAGPDHPFAMTMDEFADMIAQLRTLEVALGDGNKLPVQSELEKQYRLRRGVYDPSTLYPAADGKGIWLRPQPQGPAPAGG
ncbi:MAG: N-acetylneuraminate synthase family protein [Pseudomonadota bacterium]